MIFIRKIKNWIKRRLVYYNSSVPYVFSGGRNDLAGKIAVITGGSGVIGRSIAIKLAGMGAKVYVSGTSLEKINLVVDEIKTMGFNAEALEMDLKNELDIEAQFRKIYNRESSIDILVNSAGGSSRDKNENICSLPVGVLDDILDVNLRGTILCCREASKYMINSGYGKIICITSVIGLNGKARFSDYAAAKAGIIAFVKSIAMELGPHGITVNCVSPGKVPRGLISGIHADSIKKTNYLNRLGTPHDVANAVGFLVQDGSEFITGQNLVVDGGRSLGLKGD